MIVNILQDSSNTPHNNENRSDTWTETDFKKQIDIKDIYDKVYFKANVLLKKDDTF